MKRINISGTPSTGDIFSLPFGIPRGTKCLDSSGKVLGEVVESIDEKTALLHINDVDTLRRARKGKVLSIGYQADDQEAVSLTVL